LCFQFFSLNHIFFCLSHHGTVSRAKFPVPDDDGFKLFTSLVRCASHSTSSSTQDWEDDSTALLMNLFEEKFLANNMNSLTQQQWQEILLRIEEAFPSTLRTLEFKFSAKYTKCRRNLISWNRSIQSSAGQCKWPWFEQCLMIWGKTSKACGTAGSMDNGVPTDSVGGFA